MRATLTLVPLISLACLVAPLSLAGTPEAPEIVDPAGDCSFAPGNHYMDIIAVWFSDETATDIKVNIQLSEWIDPVAHGAGFAVQFTHQEVEFGVLAAYIGRWEYGNGRVTGSEVEAWNTTEGSFQASPPVISILFHKSNFPHTDPTDNQLVDIYGGSIDLKPIMPAFFVPTTLPAYPPALECDAVVADKPYVFQAGGHSMHDNSAGGSGSGSGSGSGNTTATPGDAADAEEAVVSPAAAPSEPATTGIPGPGLLLVAAALAVAIGLRRR